MSKRVESAIAILERVRGKLKGPLQTELDSAIAWLQPSPEAIRQRKWKADHPVTATVTSNTNSNAEGNAIAPDPTLVPSPKRRNGTRKDPGSPSPLSLLSSEKTVQDSTDIRAAVWRAYAAAYQRRYGVAPTRNAKVNGQVTQYVTRVPHEDAPGIAGFYVQSANAFYASQKHPIGLLLKDAEGLRTEYLTGRQVTASAARRQDHRADRAEQYEESFARLRAEDEAERAKGVGDGT